MTGSGRGGKTVPLGYQEPISCYAECGVMVEPAPVATFKVPQPQLLFQLPARVNSFETLSSGIY
jgi:hypothetical protein